MENKKDSKDVIVANNNIKALFVVLIDENGVNRGRMQLEKAKSIAYIAKLDLVQVDNNTQTPICKVLDLGKYKYKLSKRDKGTQDQVVKTIEFFGNIDQNDLNTKIKHVKEFLEKKFKVVYTVKWRNREFQHPEIGTEKYNRSLLEFAHLAKWDAPKINNRNLSTVLIPL